MAAGRDQEGRPAFALNAKQAELKALCAGPAKHVLCYGGSRGGKTFGFLETIVRRAIAAPGSRHLVTRYRYNACRRTVRLDTLPKLMRLAFPGVQWTPKDADGYILIETPGDPAEIWIGGLDSPERIDKVLGAEFATIFVNEASEVPWSVVETLKTRLAQQAIIDLPGAPQHGRPLRHKAFFDLNPTSRRHWSYRLFVEGVNPAENKPVDDPSDYAVMTISPRDNQHLSPDYLKSLEGLSRLQRIRFLEGRYLDSVEGALFASRMFRRISRSALPRLTRIVIGVDPSGAKSSTDAAADETGIVIAGKGEDGLLYVLEDLSVRAGPAVWADLVAAAASRLLKGAHNMGYTVEVIVESNYGGPMAATLIQNAGCGAPVRSIPADQKKHIRAEPIAGLYDNGLVRHVGEASDFEDLEDQLMQFTTAGYIGSGSPDRADALVWALGGLSIMPEGAKPATSSARY